MGEQDALLDFCRRQVHPDRQQEAIKLWLRQREGAVAIGVVLSRDDEEWLGQRPGDTIERDLMLIHALEQGALDARRGAIDFVGEQAVGKDRAGDEFEIATIHPIQRVAEEIRWQEIGRKLDALEISTDRGGERVRQ